MSKKTKIAMCVALVLNSVNVAPVALASTTTATIPVSVTVIDSCIVDATPVVFGNYTGISGGSSSAAATVSPTCTVGTAYTIELCAGLGNSATYANRKLTGPSGSVINYNLYSDAARTVVWGDGSAGTARPSGIGTGTAQPISLYCSVPSAQAVAVGSYSDTVTVTLTY